MLKDVLESLTIEGVLFERLPGARVRCLACGHRCLIPPGRAGVCKVRLNREGRLRVPSGYVATGLQLDPIEKKPFFHVRPGAVTLSFGMLGCDYHCGYCQNWITSQVLRDAEAAARPARVSAAEIVAAAVRAGAPVITSTYNEPLITSEWAVQVFKLAKAQGLQTAFVSNGNATPEVLDYLQPWLDFYKVDLKGFDDRTYRRLGGTLQCVLETIRRLVQRGFWVEVVTLLVPGLNDSDAELTELTRFLASVSPDLPWHVTAFHPDYRMADGDRTSMAALLRAAEIGQRQGLRFVYAGNVPGQACSLENTYCPGCRGLLVERVGFRVQRVGLTAGGDCPSCGRGIPGRWGGVGDQAAD